MADCWSLDGCNSRVILCYWNIPEVGDLQYRKHSQAAQQEAKEKLKNIKWHCTTSPPHPSSVYHKDSTPQVTSAFPRAYLWEKFKSTEQESEEQVLVCWAQSTSSCGRMKDLLEEAVRQQLSHEHTHCHTIQDLQLFTVPQLPHLQELHTQYHRYIWHSI